MFYHENSSKSLAVRDVSTGFRSTSTVPVTLEARVSEKPFFTGAFGLVKRGAALGTRLSGLGYSCIFCLRSLSKLLNPPLNLLNTNTMKNLKNSLNIGIINCASGIEGANIQMKYIKNMNVQVLILQSLEHINSEEKVGLKQNF